MNYLGPPLNYLGQLFDDEVKRRLFVYVFFLFANATMFSLRACTGNAKAKPSAEQAGHTSRARPRVEWAGPPSLELLGASLELRGANGEILRELSEALCLHNRG